MERTTAYMPQRVIEKQRGYLWLDSEPRTVPGREHRPAYGSEARANLGEAVALVLEAHRLLAKEGTEKAAGTRVPPCQGSR